MFDHLEKTLERFAHLESMMGEQEVVRDRLKFQALAKERVDLEPVVLGYGEYKKLKAALGDAKAVLAESGADPELVQMAKDEAKSLEERLAALERQLQLMLIPKDPLDTKNIIMEIRAGAGGDEAGLFAADLFRMYQRYTETRRWKSELMACQENAVGGFKEVIFEVTGTDVYRRLKYESGVHRVQRVPTTEAQGRIHTSTVTVAVMPQAEEVDIQLNPNEIRVDVYRSSGHGGQSVNTTDSAVRVTHLPTNTVVCCQDEKSQLKNKTKALKILRSRLLEAERLRAHEKRAEHRRSQVGTGERSERIRTYNFAQGRLTDHRIGLTLYKLPAILDGDLDGVFDALAVADQEAMLRALESPDAPAPLRAKRTTNDDDDDDQ